MNGFKRAAIGLAALLAATFVATAVTQRDNYVYFWQSGLENFTFAETGHSVSSGQPYGGTTSGIVKSGEGYILVKAGRQASGSVAQWFKGKVGSGQTLACDSTGKFPYELNFAVEGTLTMVVASKTSSKTVTCENVIVAQGHFIGANNWWMGGPDMKFVFSQQQTCKLPDGLQVVTFSPQTPCVNNFNIGFR
ncbi:MAG: hypothetical protein ACREC9_13000 [Methylocella sp.]